MRVGAALLTLVLVLLAFHASSTGGMSGPTPHEAIVAAASSRSLTTNCPDHAAAAAHRCCLAVCNSLIPAHPLSLTLDLILLGKLCGCSDASKTLARLVRIDRPPKAKS